MACTRCVVLATCVLGFGLIIQASDEKVPPKPSKEPDRVERIVVINSRVLVLIDTSGSMGLADSERGPNGATCTRIQQVTDALESTDFLARLRKKHDVAVYRFDDALRRVVTLSKLPTEAETGDEPDEAKAQASSKPEPAKKRLRWRKMLVPGGSETRLGEALQQLIEAERDSPISGIILCSDGGQNAGASEDDALESVREARIPIVTIGVGSDNRPANVAVVDLVAPATAFPSDRFTIIGYLRAEGMARQRVTAELLSREATAESPGRHGAGEPVASRQITLGPDGDVTPIEFEIEPNRIGRCTYCLRVRAPKNDAVVADNTCEADVTVQGRRSRILLFAGGPTREYRFLSTMLFRNRSTTVDVHLQTARGGVSQNAAVILAEFPATREDMSDYDCVVAIDPDWRRLSTGQMELLEAWVREQGGGLLLVAGAVFMDNVQDSMHKIRGLFPVELGPRDATVVNREPATAQPRWLDFTRAGLEAGFLWLEDTAEQSQLAWEQFEGVFGCFPVRNVKPGATVLARLSDPEDGRADAGTPYLVTHFYGSGRVFYAGSGEMWRLRALDDAYFARYYTNLIGHLSQGHQLRESSRGVLLVGKNRVRVDESIEVRVQLTNALYEPLEQNHVMLEVIAQRDGTKRQVRLHADSQHRGIFAGRVPALPPGQYRLELPVPDSQDDRLVQNVSVRLPQLERESVRRNDYLLRWIAQASGGSYHLGHKSAMWAEAGKRIDAQLADKTEMVLMPADDGEVGPREKQGSP